MTGLTLERIEAIVQPTPAQEATLAPLRDAIAKSEQRLNAVCAAATPQTPVGRLDAMQQRIETEFDPEIEAMGWERIRSRIDVRTKDGRSITRWADENYRGSPHNPLSDAELEDKFRDCAAGLLDDDRVARVCGAVWALETLDDVGELLNLLSWKR